MFIYIMISLILYLNNISSEIVRKIQFQCRRNCQFACKIHISNLSNHCKLACRICRQSRVVFIFIRLCYFMDALLFFYPFWSRI